MSDAIEFGLTYITGHDRSQLLLLPEAADDYVGSDNPVRFIDAFVDGLDLAAAGFGRIAPKMTGRPAYAPADLLKLYIYGYLNRVRSSRRLEAETRRNIEVIWLLRHLKTFFGRSAYVRLCVDSERSVSSGQNRVQNRTGPGAARPGFRK
jgi:transposase